MIIKMELLSEIEKISNGMIQVSLTSIVKIIVGVIQMVIIFFEEFKKKKI